MAKRGAPIGNRNAAHDKPWTDALRRALAQFEDETLGVKRGQALDRIAMNVVRIACVQPDKDLIKELGDRLQGKAAQSVMLATDPEAPFTVTLRQDEAGL